MKKIILAALAGLLLATPAWSQREHKRNHNPEEMAQKMTDKMAERLELSEDQKEQVLKANLEFTTAMKQNRGEARNLGKAHNEKLKSILTEEQYAQFQEDRADRKKRVRKKMKERHTENYKSGAAPEDQM